MKKIIYYKKNGFKRKIQKDRISKLLKIEHPSEK